MYKHVIHSKCVRLEPAARSFTDKEWSLARPRPSCPCMPRPCMTPEQRRRRGFAWQTGNPVDVAAEFFAAPHANSPDRVVLVPDQWGPPDYGNTWIWWHAKVCVRGHRFSDWTVWGEIWVRKLSQLEEALRASDCAGMYNYRRLLLQEREWSAEDGWEELDQR